MTYHIIDNKLGAIDIGQVSSLAPGYYNLRDGTGSGAYPQLGAVVKAADPVYGEASFIYLKGATAVNAAGFLVMWSTISYVAALVTSTANLSRPVAVSMGTVTGAQYGWFQLTGTATVLKTAVKISPTQKVWISGTSGRFFATATTGKQVLGALTVNSTTIASATSTVLVMLPPMGAYAQGQII